MIEALIDKMFRREQFEHWYKAHEDAYYDFGRNVHHQRHYDDSNAQRAWNGWQAALAFTLYDKI